MFKGASLGSFGVIRGQGTASLFEGAGQAVYARERKRISVDIFEVGVGRTASIHSFHPMPEANSTSRPLLELTISVIGKKYHRAAVPNALMLLGSWLRRAQCDVCLYIGHVWFG
jgi:hypothetical protein